jgi:peptide/nickel transport system substrate-binding protein
LSYEEVRFVSHRKRAASALASLFALTLLAAACGDDNNAGGGSTTTAGGGDGSDTGDSTTTTGGGEPAGDVAMTITYHLNPDAVWEDGTPIGEADFQCTLDATMNTPGSLSTVGYDQIIDIVEGDSAQDVVVTLSSVYAPYKNLFNPILKAADVADCNDVSGDYLDSMSISGRPVLLQDWSPDQATLVPNPEYWDAEDAPEWEQVVMVPKADSDTEVASLLSGESEMIFPQAFSGLTDALNDPNIEFAPGYGTNYEGLYFQQNDGPFADDVFRQAFSESIDRDEILENIYGPIFPGAELLNCGVWVPTIGPWCDQTAFTDTFQPDHAEQILTEAGWAKGADGFWAKDGEPAPTIRWVVNTGNSRRETTQALLIPELQAAGFNVVADNCDAACYFQQRLPALDYDLAMYINTAAPDPTVTSILSCEQVPSEENNNQGQNSTGWCNEEATQLMHDSDSELDEDTRADQIHQIAALMAQDHVMLPLYQFPNIAAFRTDRISGPVTDDAANYRAFANNLFDWVPTDDNQIVIGAEQWPECLNPITECANSSWYVWTVAFQVLPGAYDTTADGNYVPTDLLTGEADVEVAE